MCSIIPLSLLLLWDLNRTFQFSKNLILYCNKIRKIYHFLLRATVLVQQVHVNVERNILQHGQEVRYSDAGEDHVDGVGPHVLVGQHEEVQDVEDTADDTNIDRQMAMDWFIQMLQLMRELSFKRIIFVRGEKLFNTQFSRKSKSF